MSGSLTTWCVTSKRGRRVKRYHAHFARRAQARLMQSRLVSVNHREVTLWKGVWLHPDGNKGLVTLLADCLSDLAVKPDVNPGGDCRWVTWVQVRT